jgi:hypothetical protein
MPFEFQPYRNPYAGTIGDLMGAPAAARARALRASATAEANATLASGQAWAGAAQNIGQIIGALPQQLQQQHRQQTVDELNDLKLADAKRDVAGERAVAGMMAGDQLPAGDAGPRQESYLDQDGLFDIKKMTSALGAGGFGDKAPELVGRAEKINDSILKHQQLEQQAASAHALMLGDLADGALTLAKTGTPLLQAMDFVVQPALATKRVDPKEYQQVRQQIAQLPPEQQTAALTAFMDQAAKLDKSETVGQGSERVDRYNRVIASGAPRAKTQPELALDAADPNSPTRQQSADALSKLHPAPRGPNSQESDFMIDGKSVKGDYIPGVNGAPGKYFYNGEDVTARAVPKPTAAAAGSADAVSNAKEQVAGMMDGSLPPVLPGRQTKEYNEIMAEAHRQGYNLTQAVIDWNATQKHISTLNNAQQTRLSQSINALPELLDSVDALASQWKGGRFPALNRANLALAKNGAFGEDVATIARQLDSQIADVTADLGNVYMGGNSPTDHALELAGKSLSGEWSEKVLHDMVKLARSNVTIRQNSIKNTGVAGASPHNPYVPPAAAPARGGDPLGIR